MKKQIKINKFNNFDDENEIKTKNCYNFLPSKKLNQSFSVKTAAFPNSADNSNCYEIDISSTEIGSIKGLASFKQYFPTEHQSVYRLMIYGQDKTEYFNQLLFNDTSIQPAYYMTFTSSPIALTFKKDDLDAIILADKEKMMVWKTYKGPYEVKDAPVITSMCMNDGVLFCTLQEPAFKIWYATDSDLENVGSVSGNSGYLSLEDDLGDAKKIITFNEDVYIFREYGISKINYLQKNITVSQVYASNSQILANTVSVCGNLIVFMAFDGIYTFNGTKVEKTNIDIQKMLDGINMSATASSLSHFYFLALRLKYEDEIKTNLDSNYVNNTILVIDTNDLSYQLMRGYDVLQFHALKTNIFEKMLFCSNSIETDKIKEIVLNTNENDNNMPKLWESEDLTNDNTVKQFVSLSCYSPKNVNFILTTNNGKSFSFTTTNDGLNKFNFKIICNKINLTISTKQTPVNIEDVCLEYYDY